jgi:acetylglutamate kinase
VHGGICQFRHSFEDIKSDTIKKTMHLESRCTSPNSVTISSAVYQMLDQRLTNELKQIPLDNEVPCFSYTLRMEK